MCGRCYRRLPPTRLSRGLSERRRAGSLGGTRARRRRQRAETPDGSMKKAFAQSERARVRGLCKVSPPAVLVRRQPFIGPVGQGCRMGCQLHVKNTFTERPEGDGEVCATSSLPGRTAHAIISSGASSWRSHVPSARMHRGMHWVCVSRTPGWSSCQFVFESTPLSTADHAFWT